MAKIIFDKDPDAPVAPAIPSADNPPALQDNDGFGWCQDADQVAAFKKWQRDGIHDAK